MLSKTSGHTKELTPWQARCFQSHVEVDAMILNHEFTESEIDEATLEAKDDIEIRNRLMAILEKKGK
jgi:hypothetical protein